MARGQAVPQQQQGSDPNTRIEVLSTLPPKEIDFSNGPVGVAASQEERASMALDVVAPIVRDATMQQPPRIPGQPPPAQTTNPVDVQVSPPVRLRRFRVEATKNIVDRTSGARTLMREGKEITTAQYNIRDLQQQGVKLRDITDIPDEQPL